MSGKNFLYAGMQIITTEKYPNSFNYNGIVSQLLE